MADALWPYPMSTLVARQGDRILLGLSGRQVDRQAPPTTQPSIKIEKLAFKPTPWPFGFVPTSQPAGR
jgi:hypothetical protein